MGKKGKKKKSKGPPEAGVPLKAEENNTYLGMQCETLERELRIKSAEAEEALRSEMELRAKVEQMEGHFKQEQGTTFAIAADMARQYKALQEELIFKINSLEALLTEQKEELDMTNHELRELIRDKDDDIELKDRQISELNERMNEMSQEFAGMLAETLQLMKTHMEEKLAGDADQEASKPDYAQQLQEYSVKAYSAVSASSRAALTAAGGGDQ